MSDIRKAFEQQYGYLPEIAARAPGRVEFIGNHTDYNGGEVLGAAVDRFLTVAVSPRSDDRIRFATELDGEEICFDGPSDAFARAKGWVQYPVGVLSALADAGIKPPAGFDFSVASEIPSGAGLSSSAAFELASSICLEALAGVELDRLERVRLCRKAENDFVGVPCGILDQGVSGFGEKDRLVHIDCATEKIQTVCGPQNSRIWIFESGKKHSLVDSLYSERNGECREAFDRLKREVPSMDFLVNVTAGQLLGYMPVLADNVFRRARHVVEEHERVQRCVELLAAGDLPGVGELLSQSHWSSSNLFENSTLELDAIVRFLQEEDNVYGARLTGGGFGGAVMALCSDTFTEDQAERVAERYSGKFGYKPKYCSLLIADGATREPC